MSSEIKSKCFILLNSGVLIVFFKEQLFSPNIRRALIGQTSGPSYPSSYFTQLPIISSDCLCFFVPPSAAVYVSTDKLLGKNNLDMLVFTKNVW